MPSANTFAESQLLSVTSRIAGKMAAMRKKVWQKAVK
jgi:hypothetical protein